MIGETMPYRHWKRCSRAQPNLRLANDGSLSLQKPRGVLASGGQL